RPRLAILREAECFVRAERSDFQRLDRLLEVVDGTRGRCEVQYVIERAVDVDVVGDVVFDEAEAVAAEEVLDVFRIAGDEVVHADDFVSAIEKELAEVRAEEAGAAGDERAGHYFCASSARPTDV